MFDPLAIAMVIAANFAFSKLKKEEPEPFPHHSPQPIIPRETIMEELNKEEEINRISTLVGKEEKKLQPIKPSVEDLKKIQEVLGLTEDKNKSINEKEIKPLSDNSSESETHKKDINL